MTSCDCAKCRQTEGDTSTPESDAMAAQIFEDVSAETINEYAQRAHEKIAPELDPEKVRQVVTNSMYFGIRSATAAINDQLRMHALSLREYHERLCGMAKLYQNTPTVMEHVTPLLAIGQALARREVHEASLRVYSMAEQVGISKDVIDGNTKESDMLPEEFAMIGDRVLGNSEFGKRLMELTGLGDPEKKASLGRAGVAKYKALMHGIQTTGKDYVENGNTTPFMRLVAQVL